MSKNKDYVDQVFFEEYFKSILQKKHFTFSFESNVEKDFSKYIERIYSENFKKGILIIAIISAVVTVIGLFSKLLLALSMILFLAIISFVSYALFKRKNNTKTVNITRIVFHMALQCYYIVLTGMIYYFVSYDLSKCFLFSFVIIYIWSFLISGRKYSLTLKLNTFCILSSCLLLIFVIKSSPIQFSFFFIMQVIMLFSMFVFSRNIDYSHRKEYFMRLIMLDQKEAVEKLNVNLEKLVKIRTNEFEKKNNELLEEIEIRKSIEENRDKLVHDLRQLNNTAMSFIDVNKDFNVYEMIATNIRYFIGECIVFTSSYDFDNKRMKFESINGPQDLVDNLLKIFDNKLSDLSIKFSDRVMKIIETGIIESLDIQKKELEILDIAENKQKQLYDFLTIGETFAIGFTVGKSLLGCAIIITFDKITNLPIELIETFAKQATIAIQSKLVRDEQLESERKFHFLIDNAVDAIFVADLDGNFLEVNKFACESLNYNKEELLKMNFKDIENLSQHNNLMKSCIYDENKKSTYYSDFLTKNNELIPVEVRIAFLNNGVNKLIIAFARDITDRIKNEEEIKKFKKISDNSNLGMIITTIGGEINYVNSYLADLFGYTINGLIAEDISILFSEIDLSLYIIKCSEIYKYGSFNSTEFSLRHIEGREIPVLINGVGLFDNNGILQHIAVTVLDITNLKNTEKQLQYRLQIENMLNMISKIFLENSTESLEVKIQKSIEILGEIDYVDRSYIFEYDYSNHTFSNKYEWVEKGVSSEIENLQEIPIEALPWFNNMMRANLIVNISDVEELPVEASKEKELFQEESIKSLIVVPMTYQENLIGFLGLDSVKNYKQWSEQDISILKTITEIIINGINRKMITDSIKESEEKYRRLFEDSKDMVFETTPDGKLVDINRAGVEMLGYDTKSELQGIDVADHYIDPRLREQYVSLMEKQGYVKDYESILLRKNGDIIYIIESATAIKNEQGKIISYRGVIKDISARVENENQLKSVNKELELSYRRQKLIQQVMIRQEKMASIGQLSAGVAHEINNPLGFVSSNFATLRKYIQSITEYMEEMKNIVFNSLDDSGLNHDDIDKQLRKLKRKKKIDYILEDVEELLSESDEGFERIKSIVQNMKSFARMDMGDEFDDINLNEAIEKTLVVARNEVKYVADVVKDFSEVPLIKGHRSEINQVILNLVVNAADAIEEEQRKEKGTILIKTYLEDDFVCIMIKDDGPGIKEELIHKIFDPFFTSKEQGKGTGLGLYISYDIIVNKHGGIIEVQNNEDKGTRFIIKLPLIQKERNSNEFDMEQ